MNKSCLFYGPNNDVASTLKSALTSAGWQLNNVADVSFKIQPTRPIDQLTGIFVFDETNFQSDITSDILASNHSINWIAITHPHYLSNIKHKQLLASYFFDYHTSPIDSKRLIYSIGHALGMAQLKKTLLSLKHNQLPKFKGIVGESPQILDLIRNINKAGSVDAPVLISGESGTGKELIANAIHQTSSRSGNKFVTVNCGALPTNLVNSELFGYEKGAFTGANNRKIGRIESAHQGTLFLDEIGDLPLEHQTSLLRFLQESTIDRIGSLKPTPVNVRVIAASHVDLKKAVKFGKFREDLYYRLNVLNIYSPALREHTEDIEILVHHFFDKFKHQVKNRAISFSRSSLAALKIHSWPGNVRELENRVQRAIVMSEGQLISPTDLGLGENNLTHYEHSLCSAREKAERKAIQNALKTFDNNVSHAANSLQVSRVTLYRLLKKYDIDSNSNELEP